MAFTPSPTPPNSGDPANFNAAADAFLGWMATFGGELNAELPFLSSKSWATRGGTANAITLTAGFTSLSVGMQVRFRAAAANTGAATINLDGLGAIACRTITGAALPAGYIRTDADTTATYNGTFWVVDRLVESGGNANGAFLRLADGTQICIRSLAISATAEVAVSFPAAFVALPVVAMGPSSPTILALSPMLRGLTVSGMSVCCIDRTDSLRAVTVHYQAQGRWY